MNRSIALFVALVTLLAHVLAIHTDGAGNFAFPYDQAYVGYRLARNLVFEGQMIWNPGMTAFESYPSPLWVVIAALGERLAISVNLFCQSIGVLAMLLTTILLSQFRPDRTASLIAPVFLVCSGCIAAAAANGMETSIFALFVTLAFWSFERGYGTRTSLSLILCCLTRPEATVIVAGMLVLWFLRPRHRAPETSDAPPIWCFVAPVLVIGGSILLRHRSTGFWLSPVANAIVHPHPGQTLEGLSYLRDVFTSSILPLLLVFPLVYWLRGRLSTTGARALFLVILWCVAVMLQGRNPLPFAVALVPVLPLCFLSIQEGLTEALDSASRVTRKVALFTFVLALAGSALASKEPGDIGPIPVERWHERWMKSSGSARYGYEELLGRPGLIEEIALTNRLRAVGIFARDNIDPISTVLSPWPGALAYLSRLHVYDLLGRANPEPGATRPRSWTRRERADVVAALDLGPDYVIPSIEPATHTPTTREIARAWLHELDAKREEPGRLEAIERALSKFELITIPIYGYNRSTAPIQGEPFFLLRNLRLGLRPKVEIHVDQGEFHVLVRHASHQQIVDLSVEIEDALGRTWALRPTGEPVATPGVRARTSVLIYDTGTRVTEMMHGRIPNVLDGARPVSIKAVLKNPGCEERHAFALVSEETKIQL